MIQNRNRNPTKFFLFLKQPTNNSFSTTQDFPKNKHFLSPDATRNMSVSGSKKCLFLVEFFVRIKWMIPYLINPFSVNIYQAAVIQKLFETNSAFHVKQWTTATVELLFFRRFLLVLTKLRTKY